MNQRKLWWLRMMAIAALLIVATSIGYAVGRSTSNDYVVCQPYTVKQGDTLWSIASANVGDDMDVREWIAKVQKINGIDINQAPLQPGQQILICRN